MTNGIAFYNKVSDIAEHFEEEKETLIQNLKRLCKMLFRADNMMISYTSAEEGLKEIEGLVENLKESLHKEVVETSPCIIHCEHKNEGFNTS